MSIAGPQVVSERFIVTMEGIRLRGFWGPFGKEEAIRTAENKKRDEPDSYHSFFVYRYEPVIGFTGDEKDVVFSIEGTC